MAKKRFLYLTDLHLDKVFPWSLKIFLNHLKKENPDGMFITGDISNGKETRNHLKLLSSAVDCPVYFVLGNHDYASGNIKNRKEEIKDLCKNTSNLIWMENVGVIPITDEVAVIGADGWYDAESGSPEYLRFTFDWFMVEDFKKLSTWEERIAAWRKIADKSAEDITNKLNQAIDEKYKTIYILTHYPPWKEATRDQGTFMEKFWLPYNCNLRLGRAIEKVMKDHKKRYAHICSGHTHCETSILVSRNIQCTVNGATFFGIFGNNIKNQHIMFI